MLAHVINVTKVYNEYCASKFHIQFSSDGKLSHTAHEIWWISTRYINYPYNIHIANKYTLDV